jgi:hypothetical protein
MGINEPTKSNKIENLMFVFSFPLSRERGNVSVD